MVNQDGKRMPPEHAAIRDGVASYVRDWEPWGLIDAVLEYCDIVAWPVGEDGEEVGDTPLRFKYFIRHVTEAGSGSFGDDRPTLEFKSS